MKVLSIGLDNSILDKNSHLAGRAVEYGEMVDKYVVIVPADKDRKVILSGKADAYGVGGMVKLVKLVRLYKLGKKLLRKDKFDIITVQDQYYLGWIGLKLARKFKIGIEIQAHGFEKYKGLRKLIAKYVISNAGVIRTVSQRLKKHLIKEFGVDESRITVVPIYTNIALTTGLPRRSASRPPRNDIVFLTIGRLVPVKNIEMQIRAMAEVVKKHKNVELLIVGDGNEMENYKLQITNYELEGRVKLLGWQEYLSEFYKKVDAFLLTSNTEGWGLVVIEAASFGLPIIMTDVGCAGETIKDGESGIVIPVGDQKALEEAMIKLIEEPELREKLGQGARRAVEKLPSEEETLKLYKKSWNMARNNI